MARGEDSLSGPAEPTRQDSCRSMQAKGRPKDEAQVERELQERPKFGPGQSLCHEEAHTEVLCGRRVPGRPGTSTGLSRRRTDTRQQDGSVLAARGAQPPGRRLRVALPHLYVTEI